MSRSKRVFTPPHSIPELEKGLKFKYLSQISFESEEEKREILERGKSGLISPKALELGKKYQPQIESGYLASSSVRWIGKEVGWGLFAEEKIARGKFFGEYTGIVRRNDRLYFAPLNNYCYEYPVADTIGRSYVTDGTDGNLVRFINHSSRPNLKPFHVYLDGFYHLVLVALRTIEKGEQLSYEYGARYWYLRKRPLDL